MREVTNSGNIGSIITMLIDEQHVSIEDILTEEQFRHTDHTSASQVIVTLIMNEEYIST